MRQAARELGVRYVLEGSVRKAGSRVRITSQLIDATTGSHVWADRYDRDLDDIFALQDEISQEIVTALEVKLSEGEQVRLWRKGAGDARAYEHLLRGRDYYMTFTKEANAQAKQELAKALEINPGFAGAFVLMAWAHISDARYGWTQAPEHSWQMAEEARQRAIALDENCATAYSVAAFGCLFRGDYEDALKNAEKAIALNPNGADEYHIAAMTHCYLGRPEETVDLEKQALRLNPLSPTNSLVELGRAYCQMGRYAEAIEALAQVTARRPYWLSARLLLALTYRETGRTDEAAAQVKEILRIRPGFSIEAEAKTHPYKDPDDLKRYLDGLRKAGLPE